MNYQARSGLLLAGSCRSTASMLKVKAMFSFAVPFRTEHPRIAATAVHLRHALRAAGSAAVLAAILATPSSAGVSQAPANPDPDPDKYNPGMPSIKSSSSAGSFSTDPPAAAMDRRQSDVLNRFRHKQMIEDTAKLFQLAGEVKAAADSAGSAGLSAADLRKVERIEKLAKSVAVTMKATAPPSAILR